MKEIKIGRKTYEIKSGDYILFNGACHMFCTGDGRQLDFADWHSITCLTIAKSRVKEIPLDTMEKKIVSSSGYSMIEWYFP